MTHGKNLQMLPYLAMALLASRFGYSLGSAELYPSRHQEINQVQEHPWAGSQGDAYDANGDDGSSGILLKVLFLMVNPLKVILSRSFFSWFILLKVILLKEVLLKVVLLKPCSIL